MRGPLRGGGGGGKEGEGTGGEKGGDVEGPRKWSAPGPALALGEPGRRAFSVACQMAWNALPEDLRDPSLSADNFRKTLKTHLFRNALGHLAH